MIPRVVTDLCEFAFYSFVGIAVVYCLPRKRRAPRQRAAVPVSPYGGGRDDKAAKAKSA